MDFVILDLEWNSAYSKTAHRFINEIIEFGAVRVDGCFQPVGEFSRLIAPRVKKRLSGRVRELTHLTNEEVACGSDFLAVSSAFSAFADGAVVMTWGTTDVHTLIDNYRFYTGDGHIPFLKSYCDLQEFCEKAIDRFDEGNQIGLGRFAELIGVEFDEDEQHRAAADAYLSLECLKKVAGGYPLERCVRKADSEEFYERLLFKSYFITDLSSPDVDRTKLKFICDRCGAQTKRLKGWRLKNKSFCADFCCSSCGSRFTGRVAFKKRYDSVKVTKKIIRQDSPSMKKIIS